VLVQNVSGAIGVLTLLELSLVGRHDVLCDCVGISKSVEAIGRVVSGYLVGLRRVYMSRWLWSEAEALLTLMIYCDVTVNHSSHDALMCKGGALARRNMRMVPTVSQSTR
jgi:hypothetical protein